MNVCKHFFLGLLFVIILMFGLSVTSSADEEYNLWIGDTAVSSDALSGEGWNYDPLLHTLTLDGFHYTSGLGHTENRVSSVIFYSGSEPLTIYLAESSTNTVQQSIWNSTAAAAVKTAGIYCSNADLSIAGSGSLNIKSGQIKSTAYYNETYGIYSSGKILFFDGEITSIGSYIFGEGNCCGVYGGTIIVNGGDLIAEATGTEDGGYQGIHCGNLIINRGTVSAKSSKYQYGIGISSNDGFEMNGGTVSAEGKWRGITAKSPRINGGTLIAAGGSDNGYGIYTYYEPLKIGKNAKSATVSGGISAFSREVINDIPGTGWTDYNGTTGETPISAGNGYNSYSVIQDLKGFSI